MMAADGIWRQTRLNQVAAQLAKEQARISADRVAAVAEQRKTELAQFAQEEQEFQSRLTNRAWISGSLARKRHETEWNLRLAHDPNFAQTVLETNILTMQKLGQDTTLAAQSAIEKVASLSAPFGSRVEVDPDGNGFHVRVAFMMSRLSQQEAGAVTKHSSTSDMRLEIQELSSRVLRDLYDYCGTRGIESISVTCNHTQRRAVIPPNATPDERTLLFQHTPPVPARLYRVSLDQSAAQTIMDWRCVRLSRITELSTVEYDGLKTLTITHDPFSQESAYDPAGELEF